MISSPHPFRFRKSRQGPDSGDPIRHDLQGRAAAGVAPQDVMLRWTTAGPRRPERCREPESRASKKCAPGLNHKRAERDVDGLSGGFRKEPHGMDPSPRRQVNVVDERVDCYSRTCCRRAFFGQLRVIDLLVGRAIGRAPLVARKSLPTATKAAAVLRPFATGDRATVRTPVVRTPRFVPIPLCHLADANARWHEQRAGEQKTDDGSEHSDTPLRVGMLGLSFPAVHYTVSPAKTTIPPAIQQYFWP